MRTAALLASLLVWSSSSAQEPATSGAQEQPFFGPLETSTQITYFIATGPAESKFRATDMDLAEWALRAWERSANGALEFTPAPESSALIRVYWVSASFGQYGEMRPILVDGRRGAAVFIRPDTDAFGPQIAERSRTDPLFRDTIVYLTCLHELGHALGLEHTAEFDDIMYFFGFGGDILEYFARYRTKLGVREDISGVAGLSDGDHARLEALYGSR